MKIGRSAGAAAVVENDQADEASGDGGAETPKQREPLADLLAEAGVASREDLRIALAEGLRSGERLGDVALRRGWIDEADLGRLLARQWELDFIEADAAQLDGWAAGVISAASARHMKACPLRIDDGVLSVVVSEPADARFASVRADVGTEPRFAVVTKTRLEELLDQLSELPDAPRPTR